MRYYLETIGKTGAVISTEVFSAESDEQAQKYVEKIPGDKKQVLYKLEEVGTYIKPFAKLI